MKQWEEIVDLKRRNAELLAALQVMAGVWMFCRETRSIPGPDLPPPVAKIFDELKAKEPEL